MSRLEAEASQLRLEVKGYMEQIVPHLRKSIRALEVELAVAQQTIDGLAEAKCPCCDGLYEDHPPGKNIRAERAEAEVERMKAELVTFRESCSAPQRNVLDAILGGGHEARR